MSIMMMMMRTNRRNERHLVQQVALWRMGHTSHFPSTHIYIIYFFSSFFFFDDVVFLFVFYNCYYSCFAIHPFDPLGHFLFCLTVFFFVFSRSPFLSSVSPFIILVDFSTEESLLCTEHKHDRLLEPSCEKERKRAHALMSSSMGKIDRDEGEMMRQFDG